MALFSREDPDWFLVRHVGSFPGMTKQKHVAARRGSRPAGMVVRPTGIGNAMTAVISPKNDPVAGERLLLNEGSHEPAVRPGLVRRNKPVICINGPWRLPAINVLQFFCT